MGTTTPDMVSDMCTVICRWEPGASVPVQMLALRDELASRTFDLPGLWWPDQPRVVGGRDQLGGGTWCASDVEPGVTAVVLNRAERRTAGAGAPSRGVLPLLAVKALERWPESIDLRNMASFNLVLASPEALSWWSYDGVTLLSHELDPGTYMFTPVGLVEGPLDQRFTADNVDLDNGEQSTEIAWSDWLQVIKATGTSTDPLKLLVRVPKGDDSFETVFGQFIAARPGSLRLDYVRTPDRHDSWTLARWTVRDHAASQR